MRLVELLGELTDDDRARRVGQALELIEMLTQVFPRASALERRADEERALDGLLDLNRFLGDAGLPLAQGVEASGRRIWNCKVADHRPDRHVAPYTVIHAARAE